MERLPPIANVAISNVPGPQVPLYLAGAQMKTFFPVSIITHGLALNITVQTYCGRIDFGIVACKEAVPDLHDFAVALTGGFDELIALAEAKVALEKERGEGWWGSEKMADYYARHSASEDPFNWIKAHPLMAPASMDGYPFDHAGEGETSLMMDLFPGAVDMAKLSDDKWYTRSARNASKELGARGRDLILAYLREALH